MSLWQERRDSMKAKKVELCVPCAVKLEAAGYTVRKISGGVDKKIQCVECGRRRYGVTYELSREGRKGKENEKR